MTYPIDTISIHNGASLLEAIVTDSAERSHSLQQHNYVKLVWKSADNTPIVANAYIDYDGQRFYCVDDYYPTHKDGVFEYEVEFHSIEDTFNRPIFFRHVEVGDTTWKEAEWSLNGNLLTIGNIIINSLNKCAYNAEFVLYPSDTYPKTPLKTYLFSGTSISDALSMIAEENETEWWLENAGLTNGSGQPIYYLHFDKCEYGKTLPLSDEYENINGVWESKGLKSVLQSSNTNIIPQRLYVYGSERNITKKTVEEQVQGGAMNVSYDKRLRLPELSGFQAIYENRELGLKCTINNDSSISIDGINNHFEQMKLFDEVYPKMTMIVEEVFVQNPSSENPIYWMSANDLKSLVVDPANEDKINPGKRGLLIEGCTLMCTFTSGLLNGREFECAWEESTARIGLVPIDENDVQIPFGAYTPKAGDTFILWNLEMPKSAVDKARQELLAEAIKYIEEVYTSTTETDCVSEAEAFRKHGYSDQIKVGQRISVESGVFRNGKLSSRVIKYSYKLTKPYDVSFTLASSRQTGRLAKLENMIANATQEVHSVGQVQRAISRRQWHDTEEMMQMLDSIQKQMVVVGDKNSAFVTSCKVDWDNATKLLKVSAGYLEHQSYKPNNGDSAWSINGTQMSFASMGGDAPYYVFFACPKNGLAGEIGVDVGLPQESDYYFFTLGILSSEYEGVRVFNQTSGLTTLAGGTITTEVIQDALRQLIIDFTQRKIIARKGATIVGNIKFLADDNTEVDAFTAIDGGLLLTKLIRLLDDNGNTTLGLNGNQDYDNNVGGSLKLWSGADYSNRLQAPFRVYDNGKVFGTNFYGFHSAYRVTESDIVDNMLNVRQFGSKVLLDFPTGLANALTFPSGMEYVGAEIELFNPYNRPVAICGQNIISPTIATLNNAFESVGTSAHISGYAYIYKENKARIVGSDDLYAIPRWSLKNMISCSVPNMMPNYMKWKCICFSYSSSEYNTQNVNANTYYIRVGQSAYIYFLPLWVLAESSNDITFNLEIE